MAKLPIVDPRPSKADPDARAKRKQFEKNCEHISMKEVAIKGGALALLTAVALFPWEKEYEKYEKRHRSERSQDGKKSARNPQRIEGKDESSRRRRATLTTAPAARDYDDHSAEESSGDESRGRSGYEETRRVRRVSEPGGARRSEDRRMLFLDRDREYQPYSTNQRQPSSVGMRERDRYTGEDDGDYGRRYNEARKRERRRRSMEQQY